MRANTILESGQPQCCGRSREQKEGNEVDNPHDFYDRFQFILIAGALRGFEKSILKPYAICSRVPSSSNAVTLRNLIMIVKDMRSALYSFT